MNSFQIGKEYIFLAVPLWMRGIVKEEDMRFVVLEKGAEYLPDADNLGQYLNHTVQGEVVANVTRIHKDSINVVIDV
jgi:hypothetical protein